MTRRVAVTHHAQQRWDFRFDDIDHSIEAELAKARPAPKRVRQRLMRHQYRQCRAVRESGNTPCYLLTRKCIFACAVTPDDVYVVITVLDRERARV